MKARDLMKVNLVTATEDMPLSEAARLLIENRITGLPVVDGAKRIVGVITEMDLMRTLAEPHQPWHVVADLMTQHPVTVAADAPLHDVFDCLMSHNFRRVLIEEEGKLVGLISRTDLLPTILEHLTDPSG